MRLNGGNDNSEYSMSAYGSSRFQSVLDDGSLAVLDQIGGTSTQKKASDENDTRVRPAVDAIGACAAFGLKENV